MGSDNDYHDMAARGLSPTWCKPSLDSKRTRRSMSFCSLFRHGETVTPRGAQSQSSGLEGKYLATRRAMTERYEKRTGLSSPFSNKWRLRRDENPGDMS